MSRDYLMRESDMGDYARSDDPRLEDAREPTEHTHPDKADLQGGQVPTSQLPAVALTKPMPVSDRAAMLALDVEEGDVAVVTGGDDQGTYMLGDGPADTFSSWVKLVSPDAPVQSVNGQSGTVNLSAQDVGARPESWTPTASDVGLGEVDDTSDADKPVSTAQQEAIDDKIQLVTEFPTSPTPGVLYLQADD